MLLTYRLITLVRSPKRPLLLQVTRDLDELGEGCLQIFDDGLLRRRRSLREAS
jgi:hypothetical protein